VALEPLYTVAQIADYFAVTQSTVLRWIKQYTDTETDPEPKGLKAKKINGVYRSRESWVKKFARELYVDEKKGA